MTEYLASGLGISPGGDVTAAVQSAFGVLVPGDRFVFDSPGRYSFSRQQPGDSAAVEVAGATDVTVEVRSGAELYTAQSLADSPFSIFEFTNPSGVTMTGDGAIRAAFSGEPASRTEGRLVFFNGASAHLSGCLISGLTIHVQHSTDNANAALYGVLATGNLQSANNPRGDGFTAEGLQFEPGSQGRCIQVRRVDNTTIQDCDFSAIGGDLGTVAVRPQGDSSGLVVRRNNIRISEAITATAEAIQVRPGIPSFGVVEAPQVYDNIITASCDAANASAIGMKLGASSDALVTRNLIVVDPLKSSSVRGFTFDISDTEPELDVTGMRIIENDLPGCESPYLVTSPEGGGKYESVVYRGNTADVTPNFNSATTYEQNIKLGTSGQYILGEASSASVLVYEKINGAISVLGCRQVALSQAQSLLRLVECAVNSGTVLVTNGGESVDSFSPGYTVGADHGAVVLPDVSCNICAQL